MDSGLRQLGYFDYSDRAGREATIASLYTEAKTARTATEKRWEGANKLYEFFREAFNGLGYAYNPETGKLVSISTSSDLAGLSDGYIQVESQIKPEIPDVVFRGRDGKQDAAKAKQRQYIVQSVLDRNEVATANIEHERGIGIYGDGFWKVYYDASKRFSEELTGDIAITSINLRDLFIDPAAKSLDDAEYVDYVYYMHRRKAERLFGKELKAAQIDTETVSTEGPSITEGDTATDDTSTTADTHLVQIIEHYYKDDEGDIALSMLLNDREFKHVPKYWERTRAMVKCYPFVQSYRIKRVKSLYNYSELEVIAPDLAQANKFLSAGVRNSELMSNDVWLVEENSVDDNTTISNEPGAVLEYKKGANPPKRGGGIVRMPEFIVAAKFYQDLIQRTTRNYDLNQGKEPERTTTASGQLQLRVDSQGQQNIKRLPVLQSWKKLFKLIDYCALEFYDAERLFVLGTPERYGKDEIDISGRENLDPQKGDIYFRFGSDSIKQDKDGESYYPDVDCVVDTASDAQNQQDVTTLMQIATLEVNQQNYKTVVSAVNRLKLPEKQEIIDGIMDIFEPETPEGITSQEDLLVWSMLPREVQAMVRANPSLFAIAKQTVGSGGGRPQQAGAPAQQMQTSAPAVKVPQRPAGVTVKNPQGTA